MEKGTAILLFTRVPKEEARCKNFSTRFNFRTNAAIAQQLIRKTIREIKKSRIPYNIITSDQQHGNEFGERLANAIEDTYLKGFDKVIVIGNDAPQVKAACILHAHDVFQGNKLALGPDQRGGVYLIGISKKLFNREKILTIQWNTRSVFTELKNLSDGDVGATVILSELRDVNDTHDLRYVLCEKNIACSFVRAINCISDFVVEVIIHEFSFSSNTIRQNNLYRRGPPLMFASDILC